MTDHEFKITPEVLESNYVPVGTTVDDSSPAGLALDATPATNGVSGVNPSVPSDSATVPFHTHNGVDSPRLTEIVIGNNTNSYHLDTIQGMWMGADLFANAPFSVDLAGNLVANSAVIAGYIVSGKGAFGGDGSDGALSVTSGTTTISLGGDFTIEKNYTTISVSAGATLAFSNPSDTGSVITLKSQGAVVIQGTITVVGMGGSGGPGATGANGFGGYGDNGCGNVSSSLAGTPNFPSSAGNFGGEAGGLYGFVAGKVVGLVAGAGGGGGNTGSPVTSVTGGAGARGAGALYIECGGALTFTGTLNASGSNGSAGSNGGGTQAGGGGGGGGGGGTIVVLYNTLTTMAGNTRVVDAGLGGSGGTSTVGGGNTGGGGGAGGGGANSEGNDGDATAADDGGAGGAGGEGVALVAVNTEFP